MNPNVLFVVSSDPRTSHRPAEAIRIAAGVGAWETAKINVYLHGAAVLLLADEEDTVKKHLSMLPKIYVEAQNPLLAEVKEAPHGREEISARQMAALAAESNYVVYF
jgi:hypothetical protein